MKLRIASTCAFSFVLLVAGCATTPGIEKENATVTWAGIYRFDSSERRESKTSPTGYQQSGGTTLSLVSATTKIPAELGRNFGFLYKLDPALGQNFKHQVRWTFPDSGLRNPKSEQVQHVYVGKLSCSSHEDCLVGWHFTEPWEMVSGSWTAEIVMNGRTVLTQSFEVVKP